MCYYKDVYCVELHAEKLWCVFLVNASICKH